MGYVIMGYLFYAFICAGLCESLAEQKKLNNKGYKILVGFLLGIIGLIYVAGLPDMVLRKRLQNRVNLGSFEDKNFENLPPL